jgi:hypothetical protein
MADTDPSDSPRDIVESAFSHPSFSFHGPEHHSLVPAAILIALKNRGIKTPANEEITTNMILEGIRRGAQIPGGFCGYAGDCGACVGAGIAVALFVGSTPRKAEERFQAHKATVKALTLAEDSLIRCCERSTLYGITAAMEFIAENYGADLENVPEAKSCHHWQRNRDCAKEDCYFYPNE